MPRINQLDKSVYELIAAGEVIERPASVIKELVENSIDAGAHRITVEIRRGGVLSMSVSDDGCGISFEDVPLAFSRHATSKVRKADDLENINTLGFRGEALASVCAVGKVEMVTKRSEDELGTYYNVEAGEPAGYERTGCSNGTTITVRELFFNTPARLKFLKKDVTEGNYCQNVVEKLALSHPFVSFKFFRDGRQALFTPGDGEYYSAIRAVMGKQFAAGLIPVENVYRETGITGYVTAPLFARANRSLQIFFVNGRSVKSPILCAALEEAFKNSIMVGKFPACVICVNLRPSELDANISPTKTEVRFSDEKAVFDAMYISVKNALLGFNKSREIELRPSENKTSADTSDTAADDIRTENRTLNIPTGGSVSFSADTGEAAVMTPKSDNTGRFGMNIPRFEQEEPKSSAFLNAAREEKTSDDKTPISELEGFSFLSQRSFVRKENLPEPPQPEAPEKAENIRVIGELFKTYIICESRESLILIDKHAAHERINFERFKSGMDLSGQLLLEPCEVKLTPEEYDAVSRFYGNLEKIGLGLKFTGNSTVLVESVPQTLEDSDPVDLVESVAAVLASNNENAEGALFDDALHTMACKASIRANDEQDISELAYLANMVLHNNKIRYCPHGRPVLTQISKKQIEKYFGRIV